jgi:hypothetical protein
VTVGSRGRCFAPKSLLLLASSCSSARFASHRCSACLWSRRSSTRKPQLHPPHLTMLLRPRPTPPDRARRHRIEELRRGGSPALPNRARRHWIEGAPRQIEEGEEKVAGGEEGEDDTKLAPPNRSLTAPDLAAAAPASRCQVGRRPPRPLHPPQLASVVGAGMVSAGE